MNLHNKALTDLQPTSCWHPSWADTFRSIAGAVFQKCLNLECFTSICLWRISFPSFLGVPSLSGDMLMTAVDPLVSYFSQPHLFWDHPDTYLHPHNHSLSSQPQNLHSSLQMAPRFVSIQPSAIPTSNTPSSAVFMSPKMHGTPVSHQRWMKREQTVPRSLWWERAPKSCRKNQAAVENSRKNSCWQNSQPEVMQLCPSAWSLTRVSFLLCY